MTRSMFGRVSCLSVALGLVIACGPKVRNLGDDATGGQVGVGGQGGQGVGGQGVGGQGVGGQGVGGQVVVTPYVVDPTLPIDPTCTCDSSDQICNAARQCVPRCDDSGRCARWLANRAVVDLLVEGTSLYYAVAAGTDPLGNPSTNGSLYRVETTGGTPTLIAGGLADPYKILGRYNGNTYIETMTNEGAAIVSISDAGAVSNLGQCGQNVAMWGHWIAYPDTTGSKVIGIDLTGNLTPVVLAQVSTGGDPSTQIVAPAVLDSYILYQTSNPYQTCSIQVSNLVQGSTCTDGVTFGQFGQDMPYLAVSATGDKYFVSGTGAGFGVSSFAPPNTRLLTLYDPNQDGRAYWSAKIKYANSWLYVDLYSGASVDLTSRLVRVPTTVGRLPQAVLPDSMATRHTRLDAGSISNEMVFAVDDAAFYWVQATAPSNSNQAQYIFSTPLPPQPCDAELPCADSTQICSNGFCGPA